ncbi:preprotein translocase, SecY subunit, partial [Chlamydia psittaci 03DC29]
IYHEPRYFIRSGVLSCYCHFAIYFGTRS